MNNLESVNFQINWTLKKIFKVKAHVTIVNISVISGKLLNYVLGHTVLIS